MRHRHRLRIFLAACFFLGFLLACVGTGLNVASGLFGAISSVTLQTAAAMFCTIDSRVVGKPLVHMAQWTIFLTWPVAVPIYLIWSRGWMGWLFVGVFGAAIVATMIIAAMIALVLQHAVA